jgi:hypothetical protein
LPTAAQDNPVAKLGKPAFSDVRSWDLFGDELANVRGQQIGDVMKDGWNQPALPQWAALVIGATRCGQGTVDRAAGYLTAIKAELGAIRAAAHREHPEEDRPSLLLDSRTALVTSLMLAHKMDEDNSILPTVWAQISRLDVFNLNEAERVLLSKTEFRF